MKKKKGVIIQNSVAELLLTVDVGWCMSPPSLSSPARVANRHYEGLSSIEVLIDAILMLSIIINYNNLQHVHREMGTIQKLVIEIVQRQLKHLWLAAASKLLKRGIYINKGFPLPEGACVSSKGLWLPFLVSGHPAVNGRVQLHDHIYSFPL